MDALSALNMVMGPKDAAKINGGIQDVAPKAIPLDDLKKLSLGPATAQLGSIDGGGGSFQNLLSNFAGEVNSQQSAAGDAIAGLLSGKNVSLHQAMITMQEASLSFQMMVEVRNKLLDSYQELMRMQV
jgi:flagellar hook-basal body complex protein FliE